MKIIISPAKKMNENTDFFPAEEIPAFTERTKILLEKIKSLTCQEAREMWQCNQKLAELNYQRFRRMTPAGLENLSAMTPALMAYEGIQYQYLSPMTFEEKAWQYAREHLRILSGFYGILRPFDGVFPYRLEMQAKLSADGCKNLYEFWGGSLYDSLISEEKGTRPVILNLASKEYSQCIEPCLKGPVRFITCVFGERRDGKIRQKATLAKMARGEMVRFLAENQIENPEDIKDFRGLGFAYSSEHSAVSVGKLGQKLETYTFIKEEGILCT